MNAKLTSLFHFNAAAAAYLLGLVLLTGFVAGIYPAFVLSSSRVINAVKGKIDTAKGGWALRKSMLVVQFTLAIVVFITALTVSRQVSYIFSKDIGYNKEGVLVLTAFPKQWDSIGVSKMIGIKNALQRLPVVKDASISFEIPTRKPPNSVDMQPLNGDGRKVLVAACGADENYASTFGLKVLSGSPFSQGGGYVPNQVVLNESAVKALGLTVASAVGTQIKSPSGGTVSTVAGVVKDYHYSSLQEQIEPVAFFTSGTPRLTAFFR